MKVTKDSILASNEHYDEAMEARTDQEAFYHLSKAIELDPAHTDAWLAFMNHLPPQTAYEEIEVLRKLVARADEAIGEKCIYRSCRAFLGVS